MCAGQMLCCIFRLHQLSIAFFMNNGKSFSGNKKTTRKNMKAFQEYLETLSVTPGKTVNLKKDFHTDFDSKMFNKEEGEELLRMGLEQIAVMQDKLYAHNEYSMLIVLQAMDAAGKDGAIKHVMRGLNPSGVKVHSFKAPSATELEHDYFWRHYKTLPARGEIGIFNRSHYEEVLVTRVHPEYIVGQNIPGINSVKDIKKSFWQKRFEQINRFEKNLFENGTIVLKFFLHVGKDEQKKRLLDRIDDPSKNWKFDLGDLKERQYWDNYQEAYADMLQATSTSYAPWFVLPADDKWFTRLCLAGIMYYQFEKLKIDYPSVSDEVKAKLQEAKLELLGNKSIAVKP